MQFKSNQHTQIQPGITSTSLQLLTIRGHNQNKHAIFAEAMLIVVWPALQILREETPVIIHVFWMKHLPNADLRHV